MVPAVLILGVGNNFSGCLDAQGLKARTAAGLVVAIFPIALNPVRSAQTVCSAQSSRSSRSGPVGPVQSTRSSRSGPVGLVQSVQLVRSGQFISVRPRPSRSAWVYKLPPTLVLRRGLQGEPRHDDGTQHSSAEITGWGVACPAAS